jgi:hypothetical protein
MGLKQQLLDAIKKGIPKFDENENYFIIEFEGGGDEFGSFLHFDTNAEDDDEDNFDPDDYYELIMEIMDKSGIHYTFQDYGSFCRIEYGGGGLIIETESYLSFDDSEFSKTWEDEGEYEDEDDANDSYYNDPEKRFDRAFLNEEEE